MTESERYELQAVLCEAEGVRLGPATLRGHQLVWAAENLRYQAKVAWRGYTIAKGCTRLYRFRRIPGSDPSERMSLRAEKRDGFSHPPGTWMQDTDWLREQIRADRLTAVSL